MSGQATKHGLVQQIPVEKLDDSPFQVRKDVGDIDELARDIDKNSLLQPILARPRDDRYEIVHGHRRTLAVKKLGMPYILAVVRELDDESALTIHGSENIHRKNLTPIEEGQLYKNYMEMKGASLDKTAETFKVHRNTVYNKVNLLDLPPDIQDRIHSGEIPYDKAHQLTILTRTAVAGAKASQPAQCTDRWYPAIREIAGNVNLRTGKEVARTAQLVREGVPVNKAVEKAKMESARALLTRGPTPEEIVKQLRSSGFDTDSLREASLRNHLTIVKELIARGRLYCPGCGGRAVICKDCGRAYHE